MFIRLENIYSSELGKFWEMADDTTKQISAYRLASRNIVHTAFLAFSMNSIIHVALRKHIENVNPARKQNATLSLKKLRWRGSPEGAEIPALSLFSPLWAFFGTFLSQQKVTTSPPQRRREQQAKSCLLFKSIMIIMEKRLLGDRGASLTSPSPSPDIPPASSRCTS